jgi:aspartyl-tRNA(Asn)/glutamyl-tRNA(Gln) amidotransferase subunit B
MRSKEEAHDYRYFPEPDLAPLVISSAWIDDVRRSLPELPEARKTRLIATHGLSDYDADLLVRLIAGGADYFERMVAAGASPKSASNWIQGEVRRRLKDLGDDDMDRVPIGAEALADLAVLMDRGVVSSTAAKEVFDTMWATGRTAAAIIEAEGLGQIGDEAMLTELVGAVIGQHEDAVAQYRAGRTNTLGFLVGQIMKATGGKANPKVVSTLLKAALDR